jgi:hypothetical protein
MTAATTTAPTPSQTSKTTIGDRAKLKKETQNENIN